MSDQLEPNKKAPPKKGLGRGLGVLLGENRSPAQQPSVSPIEREKPPIAKQATQNAVQTLTTPTKPAPMPTAAPTPAPNQELVPTQDRIFQLDIEKLKANPKQPRRTFAPEPLRELAESIRQKGILQPIIARKSAENRYEIIAGERRWRAAQQAGLHQVPVIIREQSDQNTLELALIENIQRENLNPIEEAEAYQHLMRTYSLTQQDVADRVGKDRATVANTLRLLGLAPEVRTRLVDGRLTMGHAKVLLAVADSSLQRSLADRVQMKKLSVRDLEREVASALAKTANKDADGEFTQDISTKFMTTLSQELQRIVGTKVTIDYVKGRGKIGIHFYSDEQLNSVVDRIKDAWQK